MPRLNDTSFQFLLTWEVGGGEPYYNRFCASPAWPGEQSGVTIGVGYDLGYNTPEEFKQTWGAQLPPDIVDRLGGCCGTKGPTAEAVLAALKDVQVPWSAAIAVFENVTVPKFYALAQKAFPGFDALRDNAKGALVSLVFNRGTAMNGPSRMEMRRIQQLVPALDYEGIATAIQAMKRLWPNTPGLCNRRDAEALLVRTP